MMQFPNNMDSPLEREIREKQELHKALCGLDEFKKCISALVESYIKMIDMKVSAQDKKLDEMKNDVEATATTILRDALNEGKIIIEATYNPETESLMIGGEINE